MLWIVRLLTTTSNDAEGNGRARASASTMSTRSLTPSAIALRSAAARFVAALIAAPPQIRSHRPAARKPAGRQHQYRAAAASHVQDMLVTPQAQDRNSV